MSFVGELIVSAHEVGVSYCIQMQYVVTFQQS